MNRAFSLHQAISGNGKTMELTLNLAGTNVTISFLDQAKKAAPWCSHLFRGFVQPGKSEGSQIDVSILKKTNEGFPVRSTARNPVFEQLLPTEDVAVIGGFVAQALIKSMKNPV